MTALHKPERATYGQAVEAQQEYDDMICIGNVAICWGEDDRKCCP